MKPWELLGQARTPDGATMMLTRSGDEYVIRVDAQQLMSSRMHGSEEALARVACEGAAALPRPRVLVGGLGMGFTLRATLGSAPTGRQCAGRRAAPCCRRLESQPLGELAGHPLGNPRVEVEVGDVGATLRASTDRFDAVLLDVDNGPSRSRRRRTTAFTTSRGWQRRAPR